MIYSLHRFGCMFDEYFLFDFPRLNTKARESFVTDKGRWDLYKQMNSPQSTEIFDRKEKTFDYFKNYYGRKLVFISAETDRESFEQFAKKHKLVVVKPCNSSGGRGVRIFDCTSDYEIQQAFSYILAFKTGVVCEEYIHQCSFMSKIHPSSVNTVRVITVKDNDGVHIVYSILRVGRGNSIVDNAAAGGIFARIDDETGIVVTKAKDELGNEYLRHPDSGVVFPGLELPEWNSLLILVNCLAMVLLDSHYVGWDLAHTQNGWLMIEGNPCAQLVMQQFLSKVGLKDKIEKYIENM